MVQELSYAWIKQNNQIELKFYLRSEFIRVDYLQIKGIKMKRNYSTNPKLLQLEVDYDTHKEGVSILFKMIGGSIALGATLSIIVYGASALIN